jgi:hypothetical protein
VRSTFCFFFDFSKPLFTSKTLFTRADKLLFTSSVDVEANAVLVAKNTGSTVVYYKWSRCEAAKMAGARPDDTVRFFLADMQGSILPGCSKSFTFTFVSHASGT